MVYEIRLDRKRGAKKRKENGGGGGGRNATIVVVVVTKLGGRIPMNREVEKILPAILKTVGG